MSKRYLDDVLSPDTGTSDSDSSIENLNADNYRIDIVNDNARRDDIDRIQSSNLNHEPPYNLEGVFAIDDDEHGDEMVRKDSDRRQDITEDNDDSFVPDITTPPRERKRVRFGINEKGGDEDFNNVSPWDFKRLIRKFYKEQLPDTYQIRNWKRPSKDMLTNFIDLIENNIELASEEVFKQYHQELNQLYPDSEEQAKLKDSLENKVFDTTYNIKKRLKRTKVPSKIWVDNLNMEYIYAKGESIKKRYKSELDRAEAIERQLIREEEHLKSLQEKGETQAKKRKQVLSKELSELSKTMHPSLSVALSNTFGLIKDDKMSNEIYQQDKIDFNLKLKTDFSKPLISEKEENSLNGLTNAMDNNRELVNEIFGKISALLQPKKNSNE